VSWRADCEPSGAIRVWDHLFGLRIRAGRLSDRHVETYRLDDGRERRFTYALRGRVRRSTVKGTLRVRVSTSASHDRPASECDTGEVSWTARTG
jgi:hypothetical protein